jgi:hypothetical protein
VMRKKVQGEFRQRKPSEKRAKRHGRKVVVESRGY